MARSVYFVTLVFLRLVLVLFDDTCRCSTRSESFRSDVLILCMYCSYSREIMDSVSEVLIYSPSSLFRVEILSHLGAPITLSVAKAMTIITLDVQYMVRNN